MVTPKLAVHFAREIFREQPLTQSLVVPVDIATAKVDGIGFRSNHGHFHGAVPGSLFLTRIARIDTDRTKVAAIAPCLMVFPDSPFTVLN